MNRQTAEALEASIAHWDANAKAQKPGDASVSGDDCALCGLFFRQPDRCKGCPVANRGKSWCDNTPFEAASFAFHDWADGRVDAKEFHAAAIAERDFLISLREPIDEESADPSDANRGTANV